MREARQRERFLDEVLVARAADARLATETGEHLDADGAREPLVVAAEHDAVAARRDLFDDAIAVEHHVADAHLHGRLLRLLRRRSHLPRWYQRLWGRQPVRDREDSVLIDEVSDDECGVSRGESREGDRAVVVERVQLTV